MGLTDKTKGYLMVTLCGIFWGSMFFYVQYLFDKGLTSKELVFWKMFFGLIVIAGYTFFKDRKLFKIDKNGLFFTAIMGFVCHAIYNFLMFSATELTSIATAVSLLYTAPIFVMVMSRFFFKERLTPNKLIALIFCTLGVVLTVTGGSLNSLNFNVAGVLFGLFGGLTYGTMNMFSKALLQKYNQLTILNYTFAFAVVFSLLFSNPMVVIGMEFDPWVWLNLILLGVFPTAVSYFLFTGGLSYGIESSKAAIIATIEVPVSVLGSYFFFGQDIFGWKIVGIIMVLASVMILESKAIVFAQARKVVE